MTTHERQGAPSLADLPAKFQPVRYSADSTHDHYEQGYLDGYTEEQR